MESELAGGAIIGVLSGFAAALGAMQAFGARLKRLERDVDALAGAVTGEDGLQVRVAVLERRS